MRMKLKAISATILLSTTLAAGCSRSALLGNLEIGAATQAVLIGDGQEAPAGTVLPEAVAVKVMDDLGKPVANQIVNFVVTEGGGEVYAGAAVTDANGFARDWWTLGAQPGSNRLEARAVERSTGAPIVFGTFEATGL